MAFIGLVLATDDVECVTVTDVASVWSVVSDWADGYEVVTSVAYCCTPDVVDRLVMSADE